jgi:putative endonuclease
MASSSRVLYVGVTSDLNKRVLEHKLKTKVGFTSRYNCVKLVYFEQLSDPGQAIAREKQLKGWSRAKKVALVNEGNPMWLDLSADWATPEEPEP